MSVHIVVAKKGEGKSVVIPRETTLYDSGTSHYLVLITDNLGPISLPKVITEEEVSKSEEFIESDVVDLLERILADNQKDLLQVDLKHGEK